MFNLVFLLPYLVFTLYVNTNTLYVNTLYVFVFPANYLPNCFFFVLLFVLLKFNFLKKYALEHRVNLKTKHRDNLKTKTKLKTLKPN